MQAAYATGYALAETVVDAVAMRARGVAMVLVVLPLSVAYRGARVVRRWVARVVRLVGRAARTRWVGWAVLALVPFQVVGDGVEAREARVEHAERVERVVRAVRARATAGKATKPMCTSRAAWANLSTRITTYKDDADTINVGELENVVGLDEAALTVTVEPQATVGEITDWLVPRGFMMATTLEIREATIGGLAMAVGMTTSSHKYGLLQDTVVEYEVVLGDGSHVRLRRGDEQFEDLFHALAWSHGSVALLVGLTLRVIRVKPFVHLKYDVYTSQQAYAAAIRGAADDDTDATGADFVEATVFSPSEAVVMTAKFADRSDFPRLAVVDVAAWWREWFYKRIEGVWRRHRGKGSGSHEELVPTLSYIFRHDRAVFWTLRDQLDERVGNSLPFRLLLGWMLPPQVTLLKLPAFTRKLREEMRSLRVYQDIVLPMSALERAIDASFDLVDISPVLVYPSKIFDYGPALRGTFPTRAVDANVCSSSREALAKNEFPRAGMFFDLGVYGIARQVRLGEPYDGVRVGRAFEALAKDVGGAPFLYAMNFFSREEFEQMFDLGLYTRVRAKYLCEGNFVDLFTKVASNKA